MQLNAVYIRLTYISKSNSLFIDNQCNIITLFQFNTLHSS